MFCKYSIIIASSGNKKNDSLSESQSSILFTEGLGLYCGAYCGVQYFS